MADPVEKAMAATPGMTGKVGSAAWWTAKKALWITPLLGLFAVAAAPAAATAAVTAAAPTGLGAGIMSGQIGLFSAGADVFKYGITEIIPYAWGQGLPAVAAAAKASLLAGSGALSHYLATPVP